MSKEQETILALARALEDVLKHYWDGRRCDVRKQFHAMVAENEARKLLDSLKETEEKAA